MPAKEPQKFGLGAYWPDDYTDYLVHFHDPFAVFRIEADREGPIPTARRHFHGRLHARDGWPRCRGANHGRSAGADPHGAGGGQ